MSSGDEERLVVTAQVASAVVAAQFPELAPASATYLNEGCDSAAFVINDAWVFRFPKRADVDGQLGIETRMLSVLEERSPLRVPAFRFHGRPSAEYPFHFVGYAKIPGVAGIQLVTAGVPFEKVAIELGRFLTWLHALPPELPQRFGVAQQALDQLIDECRLDALDDFERVVTVAPRAPLDQWHAFLAARPDTASLSATVRSLIHNDLAAEHLLFDPDSYKITGVVDWSDLAIGHPAADFAGVFHWGGEDFMTAVLRSYAERADGSFVACARYLGACRGVGDVTFGLEKNRQEYVAAGVRALALCVPRSRSETESTGAG